MIQLRVNIDLWENNAIGKNTHQDQLDCSGINQHIDINISSGHFN